MELSSQISHAHHHDLSACGTHRAILHTAHHSLFTKLSPAILLHCTHFPAHCFYIHTPFVVGASAHSTVSGLASLRLCLHTISSLGDLGGGYHTPETPHLGRDGSHLWWGDCLTTPQGPPDFIWFSPVVCLYMGGLTFLWSTSPASRRLYLFISDVGTTHATHLTHISLMFDSLSHISADSLYLCWGHTHLTTTVIYTHGGDTAHTHHTSRSLNGSHSLNSIISEHTRCLSTTHMTTHAYTHLHGYVSLNLSPPHAC